LNRLKSPKPHVSTPLTDGSSGKTVDPPTKSGLDENNIGVDITRQVLVNDVQPEGEI